MNRQSKNSDLLARMRSGAELSTPQQLSLIVRLSIPAILAQISSIIMQYIDASMIGRLSPNDGAAIGLVSSSTWLLGGLCMAAGTGFTVQIANRIGAGEERKARDLVKLGLLSVLAFSVVLASVFSCRSGSAANPGSGQRRRSISWFLRCRCPLCRSTPPRPACCSAAAT